MVPAMARAFALNLQHLRGSRVEVLRSAIVLGCALALIAADQFLPF